MVLHQEVKLGERKHNCPSGDCESTPEGFIIVLFLDKAAAQITATTYDFK